MLALAGCASADPISHVSHASGASDAHASSTHRARHRAHKPLGKTKAHRAELTVTYWPHGQGSLPAVTWSLRCDPAGGNHPHRAAACAAIEHSPRALGRATRVCAARARPGSPEARITGTFAGHRVDRLYRPTCQGWQRLHLVLTGH